MQVKFGRRGVGLESRLAGGTDALADRISELRETRVHAAKVIQRGQRAKKEGSLP